MTKKILLLAVCLLAVCAFSTPVMAQAGSDGPLTIKSAVDVGACSTHARLMRRACYADRWDDFLVHSADCVYVTAAEDRKECREEAWEERAEKKEECEDVYEARLDICEVVGEEPFALDLDPADFVDPDDIGDTVTPNQYWPLQAERTHVIVADGEVTIVTNQDDTRDVGGLPCRVVWDLVFEEEDDGAGGFEYAAAEVTQDWYAQHLNGDVVYCGENTYETEDDLILGTDGSFANGEERARAGFLLREMPVVGDGDRQEMASDEAEDFVEYVSLASGPSAAEGGEGTIACNGGCLQTREVNPHDPGEAEYKYYLPGTGFVLATKLEDDVPTGEREEVTCIVDSLAEAFTEPSCGIGDAVELLDEFCAWAPEDLCEDLGP